jgi:hypothetical protein
MSRYRTRALALGGITAALGSVALVAPAAAGEFPLAATSMTGAQERPQRGDPDGRGVAEIAPRAPRGFCYELEWSKIGRPTAAHIHRGRAGVAGPIVVPLFVTPQRGTQKQACLRSSSVSNTVKNALLANPGNYYVNIHNATYPAGAIRGQLRRVLPTR